MGISRAFGPFTAALEVLLRGKKAAPRWLAAASLATALAAVSALYLLKGQVYNLYGLRLYVGPEGHAFLALAILAGVLLVAVGDLGAGKASWIGSRAERMLLLALVLGLGYYTS